MTVEFGSFLLCLVASEKINKIFDWLLPVYVIGVAILIRKSIDNPLLFTPAFSDAPRKSYVRVDRSIPLNWKRQMEGKWDLVSRKGFKELLLLMGKSSSIVWIAEKKPSTIVIKFQDPVNENVIKFDSFGVPQIEGPWVNVGTSESNATVVTTSQEGKPVFEKVWIDEEKKKIIRVRESSEHNGGYINYQERYINAQGLLVTDVVYTRTSDKTVCNVYQEQKRVSN